MIWDVRAELAQMLYFYLYANIPINSALHISG